MSINKPGALPTQAATPTVDQHNAVSQPSAPAAETSPSLQTRQPLPDVSWQHLPNDVLTSLMNILMAELESPELTSAERSAARSTLINLGSVSQREREVLDHFLHWRGLDRDRLWHQLVEASRPHWKSVADDIAAHREQLIGDFSTTRQLITAAEKSMASITLPDGCMGVELCLREVGFNPAIRALLPNLAGKTIKLDASRIGADMFANEVLPMLREIPPTCNLVIDASDNDLTPGHIEELVRLMATKCNIYRLDLSGNQMPADDGGTACMVKLFTYAGPLTHLYLANTGITGQIFTELQFAFPPVEGRNQPTMLQQLDLQDNQLNAEGAIEVMQTLIPPNYASGLMCADLSLLRLRGNPFIATPEIHQELSSVVDRLEELNSTKIPAIGDSPGNPTRQPGIIIGASGAVNSTLTVDVPMAANRMMDELLEIVCNRLAEGSKL